MNIQAQVVLCMTLAKEYGFQFYLVGKEEFDAVRILWDVSKPPKGSRPVAFTAWNSKNRSDIRIVVLDTVPEHIPYLAAHELCHALRVRWGIASDPVDSYTDDPEEHIATAFGISMCQSYGNEAPDIELPGWAYDEAWKTLKRVLQEVLIPAKGEQ